MHNVVVATQQQRNYLKVVRGRVIVPARAGTLFRRPNQQLGVNVMTLQHFCNSNRFFSRSRETHTWSTRITDYQRFKVLAGLQFHRARAINSAQLSRHRARDAERLSIDTSRQQLPLDAGERPINLDDKGLTSLKNISEIREHEQSAKLGSMLRKAVGIRVLQAFARVFNNRSTAFVYPFGYRCTMSNRCRMDVVLVAPECHA